MSSPENENQDELEALGKAVRTLARFEIQVLARKLIYRLWQTYTTRMVKSKTISGSNMVVRLEESF